MRDKPYASEAAEQRVHEMPPSNTASATMRESPLRSYVAIGFVLFAVSWIAAFKAFQGFKPSGLTASLGSNHLTGSARPRHLPQRSDAAESAKDGMQRMSRAKQHVAFPNATVEVHNKRSPEEPARLALNDTLEKYFWEAESLAHSGFEDEANTIQQADILIGTFYSPTGKFSHFSACDYGEYLHSNRWRYASLHGYQYDMVTEVLDPTRPLAWQKVLWNAIWLKKAKWVVTVDADALITGFHHRIEDLLDNNYDFIFTQDKNSLNSGVTIFKSSELSFRLLRETYASIEYLNHPWWEQAAFIRVLKSPQYKARLKILPQRALNSYPPRVLDPAGWWCKGDFILHYAGFHIASKFARSIEYPNATLGAIPACRKGQEEKAWLEWVPDQP